MQERNVIQKAPGHLGQGVLIWLAAAVLAVMGAGCAGLPDGFDRPVTAAVQDTRETRLSQLYAPMLSARPGMNGLVPLPKGKPALAARATLARMAAKTIDAQYYLLHKDLTGMLFVNELLNAADRGVRVRLLVDDMGLWGRTKGAAAMAAHPNMDIRIFNPFSRKGSRWTQMVYRFGSVTRRMHNKAYIVDNAAAILGGRNIGNEYFEADPDIEFGDLDVMAVGPVVREVSVSFDQYWNSSLAYPVEVLAGKEQTPVKLAKKRRELAEFLAGHQDSDYVTSLEASEINSQIRSGNLPFYWARASAVYDAPEKIIEARDRTDIHLSSQLSPHFQNIGQELIIFSPYFVPGEQGVAFLTSLCQRGVRVKVLTNSLASTDVTAVHAGYKRYRKALLRGGVALYELDKKITRKEKKAKKGKFGASKASLHTKSFVLDRNQVFVGSLNLDPRSFVENTEIGLVIDSEKMARELAAWFDQSVADLAFQLELRVNEDGPDQIRWHRKKQGESTVYLRDPGTSLIKRVWVDLLGLLPIESQL